MLEQKQFKISWKVEKKSKRKTRRAISRKSNSKIRRSRKDNFDTIKLSISFVGVIQPTIAKMNNFSLLQIIEIIPELRFKYMESYPFDTVPQSTKYSFAILTQPQAMIEENTGS